MHLSTAACRHGPRAAEVVAMFRTAMSRKSNLRPPRIALLWYSRLFAVPGITMYIAYVLSRTTQG